ncbi:sigma-54-dependent transcriptional regulator [Desulfospira joergensenii]|uniref:sigma-54-dependent transcriptional regulator n=1 Tax=Desulfospira joergensenii TaxID=53329 RepID=UPI0003B326D4|nr:sigma-54 dependent transcriptional regulator [Desulfospira joergensenii]
MMNKARILIVDDEIILSRSLAMAFESKGYEVCHADSGEKALERLEDFSPELVLLDIRLPGMNGITVMEKILAWNPEIPVIVMTAYGDTQTTVDAIKKGAANFVDKPFELDDIRHLVEKALDDRHFRKDYEYLKYQQRKFYRFCDLVGQSKGMKAVYKKIDMLAGTGDTTVLVRGQSGTGKELVASAIHYKSRRNKAPFIEINCASLPEQIIESELFGHEKGAFTDAKNTKKGLFELGDKGTVFLDEIGDMPMPAQAKLLRFLEKKQFRRLGSCRDIKVDVRVIAATNKDLDLAIREGGFRQDLYYRLNVITLNLPPLKERKEDILLLADYFLSQFCHEMKQAPKKLSREVKEILVRHPWEGNVRELRNLIERAIIFTKAEVIGPDVLPREFSRKSETGRDFPALEKEDPEPGEDLKTSLDRFESRLICSALEKTKGNKTKAGRRLGISRFSLNRRLERLKIRD